AAAGDAAGCRFPSVRADRRRAGGDEVDCVGRIPLAVDDVPLLVLVSLQVGHQVVGLSLTAEFAREPLLEVGNGRVPRCWANRSQELLLAPVERLVAARKGAGSFAFAQQAGTLEGRLHRCGEA